MQNNQSNSYSRWSWLIAIILGLALLWMLLTGRGPSDACCATDVAAVPVEEVSTVTEAFSFSADADNFASNGDASNVSWMENVEVLRVLLADNLMAEGDDSNVTLTGTVANEEMKVQKGLDAQAIFGPDVTVDNQLIVEAMPELQAEPVMVDPPAAKLYFNTGSSRLPVDGDSTLAPVISWMNDYPEATAVVSGYHDPTGNLARNQQLSKQRAKAAANALIAAGVDESRIEMRKPASTEGDGDLAEARRVEITIE